MIITKQTVKMNLELCLLKWQWFCRGSKKYQMLLHYDIERAKNTFKESKEDANDSFTKARDIHKSIDRVLKLINLSDKTVDELAAINEVLDGFKSKLNDLTKKIKQSKKRFNTLIYDACEELNKVYKELEYLDEYIKNKDNFYKILKIENVFKTNTRAKLKQAIKDVFNGKRDIELESIDLQKEDYNTTINKNVKKIISTYSNGQNSDLLNEMKTIYVLKEKIDIFTRADDCVQKLKYAVEAIDFYNNPQKIVKGLEETDNYAIINDENGNNSLIMVASKYMKTIYEYCYNSTEINKVENVKTDNESLQNLINSHINRIIDKKKKANKNNFILLIIGVVFCVIALLMGMFVTPIIQNRIEEQKKTEEIQLFETAKTAWENVLQYDSTGTIIVGASSCVENATELIIPATHNGKAVVGIATNAFANEKYANITTVMIPSTIKSIGEETFAGCNISSDTNGIKVIGTSQSSFANYLNEDIYESANWIVGNENETLPNLTYSEIVGIADGALKASEEHTTENTITIQLGGLKYVGKDAFANRNEIKAIQTSETKGDLSTIERIGSSAFANCNNLSGIAIHNEKVAIAENAFSGCDKLVKVTYKNGNDVVLVGTYDKANGVTCPQITPTKVGYSFSVWSIDGANEYQFGYVVQTDEITLQALLVPNTYRIYIDSNGGDEVAPIEVTYDSSYEIDVVPTRTGYTFNKYTLNGEDYVISEKYQAPKDITLKAEWDAIDYNINYNLNGGTNNPNNPSRYTIESSITLNEPTRTGYTFSGWTYSGQSTPVKNAIIPQGTTEDRTFTANWKFKSITITGQNKEQLKITDEGRWGLTQEKYDEIDISSLSSYFNDGFKFKIKIKISAKEENHGYQEIFMYNKLEIVNNKTAVSLNEDIVRRDYGLLYYKSFECGGTELDTTYDDYTFTFEVNGKDCRNKMYVRYDAYDGGNQSEDTWYKGSLYYEIVVDEV